MASTLMQSYARLGHAKREVTMRFFGSRRITISGKQYYQAARHVRGYAGVAEVTATNSVQGAVAQMLHSQPHHPSLPKKAPPYWRHIDIWKNVSKDEFLSYRWQASRSIYANILVVNKSMTGAQHYRQEREAVRFPVGSPPLSNSSTSGQWLERHRLHHTGRVPRRHQRGHEGCTDVSTTDTTYLERNRLERPSERPNTSSIRSSEVSIQTRSSSIVIRLSP